MKTLTLLKQILTSLGKNILLQAISLGCIFLSFGVAYAAWTTLSPSQWASGQPITQSLVQGIINNLNDLDARMTSFSPIPAGNIGAFNLASCPTGWIAANGSNGTPDLRGEFIRGLDNGRGVDTGRVLGTAQSDALRNHTHTLPSNIATFPGPTNIFMGGDGTAGWSTWPWSTWSFGWTETRPRNVAFLYCIKQ